jgi:hypothetical protein
MMSMGNWTRLAAIRDTLGRASLRTTDVHLSCAPTDGSTLYLRF